MIKKFKELNLFVYINVIKILQIVYGNATEVAVLLCIVTSVSYDYVHPSVVEFTRSNNAFS